MKVQKVSRTNEHFDNSKGSRLLANARAGFLRTRVFRKRFEDLDSTCTKCKSAPETLEHILMECRESDECNQEVSIKLGLHEDSTRDVVNRTKKLLEKWERESA